MNTKNIIHTIYSKHTAAKLLIFALFLTTFFMPSAQSAEDAYKPSKVIYDVSSKKTKDLNHILDRASLLERLYNNNPFESSIVIILHEGAIPLFVKSSTHYQADLIQRASSLSLGEIIEFRLCLASAKMQGFSKNDFDSFIKIIPMADAEIIKLQQQGYAYLR